MLTNLFKKKTKATKVVLLVEDDALLVKVLNKSLVDENFEVTVAMNGLEALDKAKTTKPNIIILDLVLPGLDGFGVLKQLKNTAETKNIPVVVVSNLGQVADIKSVKALGADEYFIKANTELVTIINYLKKKLGV